MKENVLERHVDADPPPQVGFALWESLPEERLVPLVSLHKLQFCVRFADFRPQVDFALKESFPEERLVLRVLIRRLQFLVLVLSEGQVVGELLLRIEMK